MRNIVDDVGEIIAKARTLDYGQAARHGREGIVGERTTSEIGLHAVRGGDIVGEHTVYFAGPGERIELTHRASSRDTFAKGALRAATWLIGAAPAFSQPIDADRMRADLQFLSSDALEGRLSLRRGSEVAIQWVASEFAKAGLKPAAGDSFLQQLALIEFLKTLKAPS